MQIHVIQTNHIKQSALTNLKVQNKYFDKLTLSDKTSSTLDFHALRLVLRFLYPSISFDIAIYLLFMYIGLISRFLFCLVDISLLGRDAIFDSNFQRYANVSCYSNSA